MPLNPSIVVVGSLNIDQTFLVDHLPLPGQTVASSRTFSSYGGKGANQAIAAKRSGAEVHLIGCVGNETAGEDYLNYLASCGIEIDAVSRSSDISIPTGSAFITVDFDGENSIIINAGANHALSPEDIDLHENLISRCDALLVQLECPIETVKRAAEIARTNKVTIVANPSPWNDAFLTAKVPCDYIILNALEAAAFTGVDPFDASLCTHNLINSMRLQGIVVTQGAEATFFRSKSDEKLEILPPVVMPLDSVGAGDAFAGAFTLALAEGMQYADAIPFANAAGALATQKSGAQSALPERSQIEDLLRNSDG